MEESQQRTCLVNPNNQWFGADMCTILVPSRIYVMLPRLSNSFNMLLKFISASKADTMFRNFPSWLAIIVVKSVWQSVKSWKLTVQVNYWCLFSRFQYLAEVSVTALRNLQSKIPRDNKPALSLLGWKLLAKPNMTHQAWQISYTLHGTISEPVKIIRVFKLNIKLELGLQKYGGKWGDLHCPMKALKGVDFYVQKSYGSGDRIILFFRVNCLHRKVAQKELRFSIVYKSQDERNRV